MNTIMTLLLLFENASIFIHICVSHCTSFYCYDIRSEVIAIPTENSRNHTSASQVRVNCQTHSHFKTLYFRITICVFFAV
jgi:hypothetical protein